MDDVRFYVLFNSITIIPGRRSDERLCATESHLQLVRFQPQARLDSGTARSVG